MNLSYIPLVIQEGEVVVQLTKEDVEEENGVWEKAIVLYVVENTPSIGTIERLIGNQWNLVQKPKVFLHNDGYFVVRFSNSDEKEEVLFKGPYSIFNRSVIIKPWAPDFNFNEEVLHTIPLWVELPNIPLNSWTNTTLSKIGSGLGKSCADACTFDME
ncbi:hypothetical protein RDI58_024554 [Solanum bulbocastanum]|uniref:DUF4283 domain-containing protein n=1 Tax=Solanum bulbocastanum TaxID=147425 RepID=A0AAN8Y3R6_SOLBU